MDMQQLELLLQGIIKLQDIEYLKVYELAKDREVVLAEIGRRQIRRDIVHEFILNYPSSPSETMQFSTLEVGANLSGVYQRLWDKAVIILFSNLVKTFLVSIAIFFVFQRMITRHLVTMANFTRRLDLNNLDKPLILNRKQTPKSNNDELGLLVNSLNSMQKRLNSEITTNKEAQTLLTYQATHDSLTGLINRYEFERRVENLISPDVKITNEHAICYIDLDQFKVINDSCGHTAGDELLRQLSLKLKSILRQRDTLARLGGDEFGVLVENCSLVNARRVAQSILNVVQAFRFSWEGHNFKVGASIGLVHIDQNTLNLSQLMRDADAACYLAKEKGRNRIHLFHYEDSEIAQRHDEIQWVERLEHALENERFRLYSQVIEPLKNNSDKHFEILIRMLDESGRVITPNHFLPAAERYNLITNIDQWVITQVFKLLSNNPTFLNSLSSCSINLSGPSVSNPEFRNFVISQFNKFGISGSKICFEITETAAISNFDSAMKFVTALKSIGCKFSLDDFGSGLSSFAYLKNIPVDYLKIDGMFVKDMLVEPINRAMVKSINDIGHTMGIKTVVEFVENDDIKSAAKEMGVDYAQGYGIGKPLDFKQLVLLTEVVADV